MNNFWFQKSTYKFLLKIIKTTGQAGYIIPWLASLSENYLINKPSPWLTFQSIDFVRKWRGNRRNLRVFEYGSGGSTLFWSKFSSLVVSIEHDRHWHQLIRTKISSTAIHDYRLVLPERKVNNEISVEDPGDPSLYGTADEQLSGCSFYNYVSQIDGFEDNFFDLILIDGRSRPACIKHSINKVSKGGLIIVDNADRDYYFKFTESLLTKFKRLQCFGVGPSNSWFWQTNIYY